MPRRKRSYIPKIKGCYECSQRRIDCDRTEPSCRKCDSKSLSCSGFGPVKFRFRDGLARGSKKSGERRYWRMMASGGSDVSAPCCIDSNNTTQGVQSRRETPENTDDCGPNASGTSSEYTSPRGTWCSSDGTATTAEAINDDLALTSPPSPTEDMYRAECRFLSPGLFVLDSSTRFLLSHFSEKIAPEMVVIDSTCNGFRHLVLPIALTDDLVLSAVLAASAFHLAGSKGYDAHPESLYAGAIRKLQQRRELTGCDVDTRQRVVLAIVVLLVVVMINGCSDFPVMFRMLQSALDAIGGEEELVNGGEVAEFSLRQIRKMRVYAAPLLSPDAGLHAMTAQSAASFDCLSYYMDKYPQHAEKFFILADLRRQAFSIYIDRVLGVPWVNEGRVENFIKTLGTFPRDAPGEHIVTWSSFIVASETRNPDSQEFFRAFLIRQFARNGFGNIPRALDLLEAVWSAGGDVDWPALLPEPKVFIM